MILLDFLLDGEKALDYDGEHKIEKHDEDKEEVGDLICLYFEHFSFWLLFTLLRIKDNIEVHAPKRISSMDRYKEKGKQVQLACRECKAKTSYYCQVCTTVHNKTVALCSGPSGKDCWVKCHKKS